MSNGEKITLRQASRHSGYHPDYLSYLIRQGDIAGEKVGRTWVTTTASVNAYLAKRSRQSFSQKVLFGISKQRALFFVLVCFMCLGVGSSFFYFEGNDTSVTEPQKESSKEARRHMTEEHKAVPLLSNEQL